MILTVTLNPSVDINYKLPTLEIDAANRVQDISKTAGGKGLNVSRVLRQLDESVMATGFLGGVLGQFIRNEIKEDGILDHFVGMDGETRNCIAIIHEDGQQTEVLEAGPEINLTEAEVFLEKFAQMIDQSDLITISGSLPKGLASDFYAKMIKIADSKGKRVLLDTSGEALKQAVESASPFLIKPNETEIKHIAGDHVQSVEDVFEALSSEVFEDVPWVFVTLGGDGAIVKANGAIYRATFPPLDVVNPVGSGDATIAGIAHGLALGETTEQVIRHGLTAGTLNALEAKTGHINVANHAKIFEQIAVEKIR